MSRLSIVAAVAALVLSSLAAADPTPLPTLAEPVDLDQYAGNWYVHGSIPLRIPFFSDADAKNYTEHYQRLSGDGVLMTSSFATLGGQRRSYSFKGRVVDGTQNAIWSIGFIWPLRAEYSIIYLDDEYQTTVVASPNRKYAWIMSRDTQMSDSEFDELLEFVASAGFDPTAFRKVPHDDAVDADSLQANVQNAD